MFTQQSLDYIKENDYKVWNEGDRYYFKHQSSGKLFIAFVGIVCVMASLMIALFEPWALLLTALIIFLTVREISKRRSKHMTIIDLQKMTFEYFDPKNESIKRKLQDISKIAVTSDLIGSYASAHRDTTDEFKIAIRARMSGGEVINLFEFITDYEMEDPIVALEGSLNQIVAKAMGLKPA